MTRARDAGTTAASGRGRARRLISRSLCFGLGLGAALALAVGPAAAACVPSDSDALLILDLSYSMLQSAGNGTNRINAARQALETAVDRFPDNGRIALRFYGSEAGGTLHTCVDSILAVPFATAAVNRLPIRAALAAARARGLTPIAYALQQAVGDFQGDHIGRTIVLVSDGSDTCGGDACAAATQLGSEGFIINTIGFLSDIHGARELQCIALASGGQFFSVRTAARLADTLLQAFGVCPIALGPPPRGGVTAAG
jgi:Ca-activated chloride channel family protein